MNRFIIADAAKCIGCRTCEVACAVSHQQDQDCSGLNPARFSSRIRVVKTGDFSTAVTCHHCEEAPCARACPVGAIYRAGRSAGGAVALYRLQKLHDRLPVWRNGDDFSAATGTEVRSLSAPRRRASLR